MTATIIPFARRIGRYRLTAPMLALPAPFTPAWQTEHLPLVDAAMVLLQADDAEFARRCRSIADAEGPTMLEHITAQLERLGRQVGEVAATMARCAARIRSTMAPACGKPP